MMIAQLSDCWSVRFLTYRGIRPHQYLNFCFKFIKATELGKKSKFQWLQKWHLKFSNFNIKEDIENEYFSYFGKVKLNFHPISVHLRIVFLK